jgi:hypothetical protein
VSDVIKETRCGKKLRAYRLNRPREYDDGVVQPVCGLRIRHKRGCLSEEALRGIRNREREKRRRKARDGNAIRNYLAGDGVLQPT